MSHKDIDALKERIRTARASGKVPTRKYRKSKLSLEQKAEFCQRLVEADVALKEAIINRDAVTWQAYKAGLPMGLMSESLGVSEGTLYERIKNLRKTLGVSK
jgi:DNA-binding NarL/FixJ family response regulator